MMEPLLLGKEEIVTRLRLLDKSRADLTEGVESDQRQFLDNLAQLVPPSTASLVSDGLITFFTLLTEIDLTKAEGYRRVNRETAALEKQLADTEGLIGALGYSQTELAKLVIEQLFELAEPLRPEIVSGAPTKN